MKLGIRVSLLALTLGLHATGQAETQRLVLYCGRGESLVGPLIERFQAQTGIEVQVRYAGSPELARLLLEEGSRSAADVFWSQDVGSLGTLHRAGLLAELPPALLQRPAAAFQFGNTTWVALSGRARVFYYRPDRLSLPQEGPTLEDLLRADLRGRVGWAPTNASFQLHVNALLELWGRERTVRWLKAMRENGTRAYANNTALLEAVAAGEVDLVLTNHYYLPRAAASRPDLGNRVQQGLFAAGDAGNLLNFSGAALLKTSRNRAEALRFLEFLLAETAQRYFLKSTHEYPVLSNIGQPSGSPPLVEIRSRMPQLDLNRLDDTEAVLALLKEAGVL